jgi:iron(III) transport system substrate-binding protein
MLKRVLAAAAVTVLLAAGAAFGQGKVVVYSPHGQDMLADLADQFKAETGITMEFLTAGGGELVDRVRAEKANPQADVMYGNPSSVFSEMKSQGLLQPYAPSWAAGLSADFKDKDGAWFGTIQTPVFIFYNSTKMSAADAPRDWADLANPKYRGLLEFRSTTSAASRATFASLIYQYYKAGTLETKGWDFLRQVDANTKQYVNNSTLMFQAIARGEASVGFWVLSDITDNVNKNKMPLAIVVPTSGVPVITDCIAIIAGAKNPAAARKFVDFAGRKDVQEKLASKYNRMPTLGAAIPQAPEWMRSMTYKPLDVDWNVLAQKQSEWLQYYEDKVRDSAKLMK